VTRLIDRWLARNTPYPGGYNETMYTGAEYYAGGADYGGQAGDAGAPGRGQERAPFGMLRQARRAYATNGVVFACEAVKMALFSEARFKFQAATDDHIFGNTDLAILEHPWPNADSGELLSRMCQDATFGNGYYRKANPAAGGNPVLVQLRPESVTIVSQEFTDDMGRRWRQPVGYFEDMGPSARPQIFTVEEVAHYSPVPDPAARWRGMSWLTPILADVHSDERLTQYKSFHLDNGAMPGLVVKYSTKLSSKTIDTLRKRIRARYGGPENAGNVLVLDEGADLTVAGSSLQDLQFDAVVKAGERRVCAAAGPGLLDIAGFESGDYKTAIRKLADLWARPHWRMACAALEHLVPTAADIGPVRLWYDVSGIAALREGELERSQSYLVTMQAVASSVQAGFTRKSATAAAHAGDVGLLVEDPNAPPPGVAGRATEKVGQGGFDAWPGPGQPPTGGPAGGIGGRPPQAGRPQQLPGLGKPNLPNAIPGAFVPMPALPAGARGAKRATDMNGEGNGRWYPVDGDD